MATRNRQYKIRDDVVQKKPKVLMSENKFPRWLNEFTRAEWKNGRITILPLSDLQCDHLQGWLQCVVGAFVEEHSLGHIAGSRLLFRLPKPPSWRMATLYFVAQKRMHLFRDAYFDGAPDLVLEIVSPKLAHSIYREKFMACKDSGVREHWTIDPALQRFEMHRLVSENYQSIREIRGKLRSCVLQGLVIKPDLLWQTPLPKLSQILRELDIT